MFTHFSVAVVLPTLFGWAACDPQAALTGVAGGTFTAAPDLANPSSSAAPSCGGCYVIADVAGLVWYSEAFINTAATAMVSVGVNNGSRTTRTSIIQNEGQFTFNVGDQATRGGAALTAVPYSPTVTVKGATLVSPTAYNLFTAYSVTSVVESNGVCSTVSGAPSTLAQPYTEILTSADGKVYLDSNGEQQFINHLGFTSCSGGPFVYNPSALVPVSSATATEIQTFTSNVPLAAITLKSPSPIHTSTAARPTAKAPLIIVGNTTITPTAHPVNLPTVNKNGTTLAVASTGLVVISPTKQPGNVSVPTIAPFINQANGWRRTDSALFVAWFLGMAGFGGLIYYV